MISIQFTKSLRTSSNIRFAVRFGIFAGAVLILGLLGCPEYVRAQNTETQQISLEQGENFVSLRVQPEDASLSTIFQGHLNQIHRVKDERGRVYMPGDGIEQFTTWEADESYKVYTISAFNVEVTGSPISLTTATVPVEKGGNLIPFVPADPQAVDDALASVSGTLVRVENENEQIYEPGGASSSLDSLRGGQGYVLYVDQPDTLTYTIQTGTLMEALKLSGVESGQYIRARGRDERGDSGGGLFRVTSSGKTTDGGLVFMFEEDLMQNTETVSGGDSEIRNYALPNSDLNWESFQVRYGPDPEDVVPIRHMHGQHTNRGVREPWVDLKTGSLQGGGWAPFENYNDQYAGNSDQWEITYEYATSDRRLERVNQTNGVNLAWWGAPKLDENNPQNATPYLAWAIEAASRIYESGTANWAYVDVPGMYHGLGTIQMPEGVILRGDPTAPLQADGLTRGGIKLMPGMGLWYLDTTYSAPRNIIHAVENKVNRYFQMTSTDGAQKLGFQQFKFDGDVLNNLDVFNTDDYSWGGGTIETFLQDSGAWQAYYKSADFPADQQIVMEDFHVREVGGSGIGIGATAQQAPDFQMDNVTVNTAYRNHLVYTPSTLGTVQDLTLNGAFWGANVMSQNASGQYNYDGTVVKDLEDGKYDWNAIFDFRRGGVTMTNTTVDLRGSTNSFQSVDVFFVTGRENTIDDLTLHTFFDGDFNNGGGTMTFWSTRNYQTAFPGKDEIRNVDIYDEGTGISLLAPNQGYNHNLLFKNVTIHKTGSSGSGAPAFATNVNSDILPLDKAARVDLKNVHNNLAGTIGANDLGNTAHPRDVFWDDGTLNNTDEFSFSNLTDNSNSDGEKRDLRIFLKDFSINTSGGGWTRQDGWIGAFSPPSAGIEKAYFPIRNVTDNNGRVSDETGTYTSDASDEGNNYVLIPTSLFTYPFETTATVKSGTPSIKSVEVANSDGSTRSPAKSSEQRDPYVRVNLDQSIGTGNTITVDWTARVTPLDRFSATGLFVARKVADQSYTSGNGPFTVELRGVASSLESDNKIVYTASSGDTSVVTADVQADDYTLKLTEQSTGTATITVTGEIGEVGTTTTTFEVTVE